jgi:hypothetical protein
MVLAGRLRRAGMTVSSTALVTRETSSLATKAGAEVGLPLRTVVFS